MKIHTLRKKAKADTLQVEDILAAAKDRIPGLRAELRQLSSELHWSLTSSLTDGTHVVPLAKWAEIAGAYAENGISGLAEMNMAPENGYYILALLQELPSNEANAAIFDLFKKAMDNPTDYLELAYQLADTLNFKFSFRCSPRPSAEQMAQARSFLMRLYPTASSEPDRCRVVCALRGVGDQETMNFLSTISPFSASYAGLEKSAQRAIRKRLQIATQSL